MRASGVNRAGSCIDTRWLNAGMDRGFSVCHAPIIHSTVDSCLRNYRGISRQVFLRFRKSLQSHETKLQIIYILGLKIRKKLHNR